MSFISSASGASRGYGYKYWEEKRVLSHERLSDHEAEGIVKGSQEYHVKIDTLHPRKSTCDCAFAHGRKVICKHMIALYFTLDPHAAQEYDRAEREAAEAWEREQIETEQKVFDCVCGMNRDELQDALLRLLFEGPQWQFDDFAEEHLK